MDYRKIYNNIVENRKLNPLQMGIYGEKHHIIPRCLGGTDDDSNIVKLTAREHFICHALLSEMYDKNTIEWYKLNNAFLMMKMQATVHRYFNARLYELKRIDFSITQSFNQLGNKNSQYGKPKSKETREKIRNSLMGELRKVDGLTNQDRRKLHTQRDIVLHTVDGIHINKCRRNKILNVFGINLNNRCKEGVGELKNLLHNLYIIEKKSTNDIAKMFSTNNETIRNYLSFVNIDRRTLSDSISNSKKD